MKYIVVESYIGDRDNPDNNVHKFGWMYEIFDDKENIPKHYFEQDETHAFWRFEAESEEDAEQQFLNAVDSNSKGLLWTYDKEEM